MRVVMCIMPNSPAHLHVSCRTSFPDLLESQLSKDILTSERIEPWTHTEGSFT